MIVNIDRASLANIEEIEKECFTDYYSYQALESSFNSPSFIGLMEFDGEIKGYILASAVLETADIEKVAVKFNYRNQKIATNLITALESDLKSKCVKEIFLEVRRSNQSAINLYKKCGYQKISERKNYYGGVEDALVYKKDL